MHRHQHDLAMKHRLGERIRMFRMAQRFKQWDLGDRVGLSQSAICRMELGETVPDAVMLVKLARALRCTVTDLLPGDDDAPFQITVRPA
jgi:transcriptional regulator with XRE-family HTH domain